MSWTASTSGAIALAFLLSACGQTNETAPQETPPTLVMPGGEYERVPLEKDVVILKLIQSSAENIEKPEDVSRAIESNLATVTRLIEQACTEGEKPNIILLHEFPLTGYIYGTRADKLSIALEIPGPESEQISALAKKHDTYIIFGSYVQDEEWPGHVLSLTTIVGRNGEIVRKVWKPRNIKRFYASFEITTTTVEGVKERFRKRYGIEEEFPVIRTEYGNIAVSTAQLDPFVFAAFAMRGAEMFLRTSTLFFESDVIHTSMVNNVFSAMANIPGESKYAGNSMVVSPLGEVMARMDRTSDGVLTAKIPMAAFRKGRRLPQFSLAMTRDIFDQFEEEIPANHLDLPEDQLPKDGREMKALLDRESRWLSKDAPR